MESYATLHAKRDQARARYEDAKKELQQAYTDLMEASDAASKAFDQEFLPSHTFLTDDEPGTYAVVYVAEQAA